MNENSNTDRNSGDASQRALLDACEPVDRGLVFHNPYTDVRGVVDFVLEGNGYVLATGANWWAKEWTAFEGIVAGVAVIIPVDLPPNTTSTARIGHWKIRATETGQASDLYSMNADEDPDERDKLSRMRRWQRENTPRYTEHLRALAREFPRLNFAPWKRRVEAWKPIDAQAAALEQMTAARDVGVFVLRGQSGRAIDVLAVDANGGAVTLFGDPWLANVASGYRVNRPDLKLFYTNLADSTPYGGGSLDVKGISTRSGSLADIAASFAGK